MLAVAGVLERKGARMGARKAVMIAVGRVVGAEWEAQRE